MTMRQDTFGAETEFKFNEEGNDLGYFEGYGAVYGNVDSHGDVIEPGAFTETLKSYHSSGRMPAMYVEHSRFIGGDLLPVGAWLDVAEDDRGLRVKGRLSALDTDHGRRMRSLMKDKVLRGLSIAFKPNANGAELVRNGANGLRRRLKSVSLSAIDIVRDPSNPLATVEGMKSLLVHADHQSAVDAIDQAMKLHLMTLKGGNSPNSDDRVQMFGHLKSARTALTGTALPEGMKAAPQTADELHELLCNVLGLPEDLARTFADRGFKSAPSNAPGDGEGSAALAEAIRGFSLSLTS